MASKASARKCTNPKASDHSRSAVLQVLVAAGLFRLCARFHIGGSKPIEFCTQNADRRRASKVLSDRRRARAYGAFAPAASHYAGSFPAPVWLQVPCQRSAVTPGSNGDGALFQLDVSN